MNVSHLHVFMKNLADLLQSNQGKSVAGDFEQFCEALAPFQTLTLPQFTEFLRRAEECRQKGWVPLPEPGKAKRARPAGARAAQPRVSKPKPKAKDDVQDIARAAQELKELFERAGGGLDVTTIEEVVNRVDGEFDKDGLIAVARSFGISSGLSTKKAAKEKILSTIADRRNKQTINQSISETLLSLPPSPPKPAGSPTPTANPAGRGESSAAGHPLEPIPTVEPVPEV